MAKLKDLIKEHATMGGVVSRNAFSGIDMGFRTQKTSKPTDLASSISVGPVPKYFARPFS